MLGIGRGDRRPVRDDAGRSTSTARARAADARRRAGDRDRQRRRRERRRLRPARPRWPISAERARRVAPRRRRVRPVRARCRRATARPRWTGVERADSVIADGHKWLNVPYDCGFAFVRDPSLPPAAVRGSAPRTCRVDDPRPNLGYPRPEMSRRARSLAVWATLRAYGRSGYRAMVERHLELAQRLSATRRRSRPSSSVWRRRALNIVCFRYAPAAVGDEELDELNLALGQDVLDDGRVFFGTTALRRPGRVPPGDRELADDRARRRSPRRRPARAGPEAHRRRRLALRAVGAQPARNRH